MKNIKELKFNNLEKAKTSIKDNTEHIKELNIIPSRFNAKIHLPLIFCLSSLNLTIKDICKCLGITEQTYNNWMHKNEEITLTRTDGLAHEATIYIHQRVNNIFKSKMREVEELKFQLENTASIISNLKNEMNDKDDQILILENKLDAIKNRIAPNPNKPKDANEKYLEQIEQAQDNKKPLLVNETKPNEDKPARKKPEPPYYIGETPEELAQRIKEMKEWSWRNFPSTIDEFTGF